jgi:peptidoglycan/xylan/chitin deacetylase (PgdA/CDA1 family)
MENCSFLERFLARHVGGFILAFHEIPPAHFATLVECLGPLRPIHLGELVQRASRRRSTAGLFAITVDDGVGGNVRTLAEVLKAKGWPATFYLPTQYLETGEGMAFQWWRTLKPLLPRGVMNLRSGPLDLSGRNAIDKLAMRMQTLWYTRPQEEYLSFTMELVEGLLKSGVERTALEPPSPITWPEVEALSADDLIRFESHGSTHTALSALTEEQVVSEMKQSRDLITERTGRQCRHLAYPYGGVGSIGGLAPSIARRYYDSAVTMSLGRIDGADPWLLPRIALYAENSRFFARLKLALKCGNLAAAREEGAIPREAGLTESG